MKKFICILIINSLCLTLIACKNDNFIIQPEQVKEENNEQIMVYLFGEVKYPGLYNVDENTRVYEVIKMAGGFTEYAKIDNLNLARPVNNNEMIVIERVSGRSNNDTNEKLININKATIEELMKLKGIGETRAKAIVNYRNEFGYFSKIDDLLNVKGITENIFNEIKNKITI